MNIIEQASTKTGISIADILGRKRDRNIVMVRQGVMWFMRKRYNMTLVDIGAWFQRDHTSVIHSVKMVDNYISTNDSLYRNVHHKIITCIDRESGRHCVPCYGVRLVNFWDK